MSDTATAITDDGFTVSSNVDTVEQMQASVPPIADETPAEKPADAPKSKPKPDAPVEDLKPAAKAQDPPKAAKPREDPQARIDQAVARQRETERRADAAERELAELRRAQAPKQDPAKLAAPPADDDPEPTFEQFADHADPALAYMKAQARWEGRQAYKAEDTKRQQTWQQQQQERAIREQAARIEAIEAAYEQDHPDYREKIAVVAQAFAANEPWTYAMRPGTPIGDAIADSDLGPQLILHLSDPSNRTELQRLSTLHPLKVLREIGRLESGFSAAPPRGSAPKAPPISKAEPPIKPLAGSATASDGPPGDDASLDEHARYYNAEEKKSRRRS